MAGRWPRWLGQAKQKSPHSQYYWQLGNKNGQWVMRKDEWKLYARAREIVRPQGIREMTAEDRKLFLVNLKEDPGETKNWAKDHPNQVEELLGLAKDYQDDLESSKKL